jgi:hypothetical protein
MVTVFLIIMNSGIDQNKWRKIFVAGINLCILVVGIVNLNYSEDQAVGPAIVGLIV